SDLGIIGYFTVNEMLGFDVALTNGEGFRYDQDEYGDVKLAGGADFKPMKGLQTRFYYDYTKSDNPLKGAKQQLFSIFAGYKFDDKFRLGAEYNYRKNHLNINKHNLYGLSVYSSVLVAKNVELFGRFDQLQANTINGNGESWYYSSIGNAYIAGIHYNPIKGVNVSLNYQGWQPKDSGINFQNHIVLSFEYKL
ncbi:MAG: outer membrane beta-barrel protein, partial [Bacteroidales bacterium]